MIMSEKEEDKKTSFKVTDRRLSFDDDETKSTDTKTTPPSKTEKEKTKEKKSEAALAEKGRTDKQDTDTLAEINFATFILSMSGSAMLHMGVMPNPETGKTEKNLSLAKQSIDIIEMIKEKTKGNLTSDEEKLLDNVLYDLRMRYVQSKEN